MKYLVPIIASIIAPLQAMAQDNSPDFMESTGKIYVVVGVLLMVLLGVIFFLISLERKVKKLESLQEVYKDSE